MATYRRIDAPMDKTEKLAIGATLAAIVVGLFLLSKVNAATAIPTTSTYKNWTITLSTPGNWTYSVTSPGGNTAPGGQYATSTQAYAAAKSAIDTYIAQGVT